MGLSIFMVGRMETGPAGDWDDPSGVFPLLEDMEEENESMKDDLIRCFQNPLYWLVLSAGQMCIRDRVGSENALFRPLFANVHKIFTSDSPEASSKSSSV